MKGSTLSDHWLQTKACFFGLIGSRHITFLGCPDMQRSRARVLDLLFVGERESRRAGGQVMRRIDGRHAGFVVL